MFAQIRARGGRSGGAGPDRRRIAKSLHRFRHGERGSLIIFGLFCLMIMLLVAGLAVDLARFEHRRTAMQSTLDRAILAAADMSQTLDPESVVNDYFARSGLGVEDVTVTVDEGFNFRTVSATTGVEVPTMFVKSMGIPSFSAPAAGTAEERIGNVEISLVLDVSGSMGWTASGTSEKKIKLLRDAASDFVATMFDTVQAPGVPAGKLSISIVPYNQQAVIGADLGQHFNLTSEHSVSTCADFYGGDYATTAITPTQALPRTAHADARYSNSSPQFVECQESAATTMMAWETSETALTNRIGQLTAYGDTAIDIGMKWGVALLDPALRQVVTDRITAGKVSPDIAGRPFDYGDIEAMKVVVVMTDGQNTNTYALKDPYRSGPSPLVEGANGRDYFHYDRSGTSYDYYSTYYNSWYRLSDIGGSYDRYSWQEVWAKHTVRYFEDRYVEEIFGYNTGFYGAAIHHTSYGTKDNQLTAICDAAKNQGIVVFAIGFEAPSSSQTLMRDCATSDAFYYNAEGLSIADAFAGIASAINVLRLTQ